MTVTYYTLDGKVTTYFDECQIMRFDESATMDDIDNYFNTNQIYGSAYRDDKIYVFDNDTCEYIALTIWLFHHFRNDGTCIAKLDTDVKEIFIETFANLLRKYL